MPDTASRASRFLGWLTGTRLGRAALGGLVLKAVVQFIRPLVGSNSAVEGLDVLASVVLVVVAGIVLVRWLGHVRRVVLWRVRRKLLVSYFLIGVVPAFLLVLFFTLAGMLIFFNVGAYMLRSQIAVLAERTRTEATTAALQLRTATSRADAARVLAERQQAAEGPLTSLSLAVIDVPGHCGPRGADGGVAGAVVGAWSQGGQPGQVPPWVTCAGYAGLIDLPDVPTGTGVAVRAVAWVPGVSRAVVADVPLGPSLANQIAQATGVSVFSISRLQGEGAWTEVRQQRPIDPNVPPVPDGTPPNRFSIGAAQIPLGGGRATQSLQWVSFVDSTDWASGNPRILLVAFGLDLLGVYRLVTASPTPPFANVSFAQVLLYGLAVIA